MTDSEGGPEALARARVHREALLDAADALDTAAARPAADVRAWKDGVAEALEELTDALDHHIDEVEGDDGLFTDVLDRSPRLAHQIGKLRAQHTALRAQVTAVGALLPAPAERAQVDEVREAVLALRTALGRHRHLGADLIWDSYDLDIGGEGD